MSKTLAASKKLMQNYLSELLTEEESGSLSKSKVTHRDTIAEKDKLDKLLQQVSVANKVDERKLDVITSVRSENKTIQASNVEQKVILPKTDEYVETEISTYKSNAKIAVRKIKEYRQSSFQVMFFDVAGLMIAVPLIELGGIHNVSKINSLLGKPDWFKGVMLYREEKIEVVDTAKWVMPEKCNKTLLDSLKYQYVIMLGDSQWGLMAENLIETVTLDQVDVKWLENTNKRPWLAGLVKKRMCALLDVDALIQMLNEGVNVNQ